MIGMIATLFGEELGKEPQRVIPLKPSSLDVFLVESEGKRYIFKGAIEDPTLEEYLQKEKEALERLQGVPRIPRIIRPFERIEMEDGTYRQGILKEFLPGRVPLDYQGIDEIGYRSLQAIVMQAHQRGVAGLDLWPGNMVVTDSGKVGLTDFSTATFNEKRAKKRFKRAVANDLRELRKYEN